MKKIFMAVMFVGIIGLLFFTGCETTEEAEEPAEYTLTVTVTDGVSGTPAAGIYTHSANDVVPYNYTVGSGYKSLSVTLDGATVANSGAVTITGNHTLAATAQSYDVRGSWSGRSWPGGGAGASDFNCRFSGEILSGTTQGRVKAINYQWVPGEYTVTNGNHIEFDLVWGENYREVRFVGTITDDNHMSGTFKYYESGKYQEDGGWELEKDS